jgi:hypothetical protein
MPVCVRMYLCMSERNIQTHTAEKLSWRLTHASVLYDALCALSCHCLECPLILPFSGHAFGFGDRKQSQKEQRAEARAEQKEEADAQLQVGYTLIRRLSQFLGPQVTCRNIFRVSAAGTPMGLVLGTSTFLKAQETDAKETKKVLCALEGGASVARVSFQKVCFCSSRHVSFAATMPRCICEIMK